MREIFLVRCLGRERLGVRLLEKEREIIEVTYLEKEIRIRCIGKERERIRCLQTKRETYILGVRV